MIEALLISGTASGLGGVRSVQPPAIYRRVQIESRPLPTIGAVGTGGLESAAYHQGRMGYRPIEVIQESVVQPPAPFVEMMELVKVGFGRTMSRLPEVFGVSRQTLYNWLAGEMPREQHHRKLQQLAEAARVFSDLGFKPTASTLDQTLMRGKSFLELMNDGSEGRDMAQKLIRQSKRAAESKAKLDELLGDRKARLATSDIGAPSLNEGA